MNLKKIGDTLTDAELNTYISLLTQNLDLNEEIIINHNVVNGEYGKYTFDISNVKIVDNGFLITNKTLIDGMEVKLSESFEASYTLYLTVLRLGEPLLFDENTNSTKFNIAINLEKDKFVEIPVDSLEEFDVILFEASVTLKHDIPEIHGDWLKELVLSADSNILQEGDDYNLTCYAIDNHDNEMEGVKINFVQQSKHFIDKGVILYKNNNWISTSNLNIISDYIGTTIKCTTTASYDANVVLRGDFEIILTLKTINTSPIRLGVNKVGDASIYSRIQCSNTKNYIYRVTRVGRNINFYRKLPNASSWDSINKENTSSLTNEDCFLRFYLYTTNNTERGVIYKDLDITYEEIIYPKNEISFYDKGVTGSKNTNWVESGSPMIATGTNGTVVASNGNSTYLANKEGTSTDLYDYSPPFVIECDIVDYIENGYIQIYDGTNNATLSLTDIGVTGNDHIKIIVGENVVKYYKNGYQFHTLQNNFNMGDCRVGFRTGSTNGGSITYKNFIIYDTVETSTTDENGVASCTKICDGGGDENYIARVQNLISPQCQLFDCKYYETVPNGALKNGELRHQNMGKSAISLSNEWKTVGTHSIKTETDTNGWAEFRVSNPRFANNECLIQFDYKSNKVTNLMAIGTNGSSENVWSMRGDILEGTGEIYYSRPISDTILKLALRQSNANFDGTVTYFDNIKIFDVPSYRKGYIWYDVGTDMVNRGSFNDGYANAEMELTSQGIHMTNGRYTNIYINRNSHGLDGTKDTVIEFDFKTANAIAHYLIDNAGSRRNQLIVVSSYGIWKHYKYVFHSDTKMFDVYVDGEQQTGVDSSEFDMTTFGFQITDGQADGEWYIKNLKIYRDDGDYILYDPFDYDTTSNYYVTGTNTKEYVTGKGLKLTVGSANKYIHYGGSYGITTDLSRFTGKTIRFKAFVEPSYQTRVGIYQLIDGSYQSTLSSYTSDKGVISVDSTIDATATRILFRVDCGNNNEGETVIIRDWKIIEIK